MNLSSVKHTLPESFLKSRKLVMVDFYADWCEPCKWADPVMMEVLGKLPISIELEKINIDTEQDLSRQFHILSVPTFILFHEGNEIWRMRGFDIAAVMTRQIETVLKEKSLIG